jgi:hypothetical protein
MKHLQSFKIFESDERLTPEQEKFLDRCVIGSWTLNPDGKIDVEGDFQGDGYLTDFKGLKFGRVSGDFWCHGNDLTSLDGAPSAVGKDFWCYRNDITSLEGGPQEVGGNYDCTPNDNLVSLQGAPKILKGEFEGPGGISILSGGWSPEGIFETWKKTRNPRGKELLGTLLTKERLQKAIDADPAGAMKMLRDYLSEDWLKGMKLIWPESTRDYVQALTDLGEIGF